MSDPTQRWAEELKTTLESVRTLRDELKVQLHMATMEARARFEALEKKLEHEEANVRKNLREVADGFRQLKDGLKH